MKAGIHSATSDRATWKCPSPRPSREGPDAQGYLREGCSRRGCHWGQASSHAHCPRITCVQVMRTPAVSATPPSAQQPQAVGRAVSSPTYREASYTPPIQISEPTQTPQPLPGCRTGSLIPSRPKLDSQCPLPPPALLCSLWMDEADPHLTCSPQNPTLVSVSCLSRLIHSKACSPGSQVCPHVEPSGLLCPPPRHTVPS